ncbi:MAG TPA: cytochrome P450 [Polyangiaceae bacterium]|nr:cytochrome P450 [Polyangiaceae bacterium]
MTPIFGKGVVFDAPLPRMNRQLSMIMPQLRDRMMRTYPAAITEEVTRMLRSWGDEGEIDLLAFTKELTIYTSTRCLIGEEFRAGITDEFFALYKDLEGGVHPLAYFLPNLPIPRFRRRDEARKKLQNIIASMMQARARNPDPPRDGLQMLIESTYEDGSRLTPNELTGILIALILAGHHTSAGTTVWCLVELLRNPEFLAPVVDEIDELLFDDAAIDYPQIRQMTGLGAVIKEVLRLHPPLIFLFRKVLRDFEFGGYTVTPGKFICASPAVSHRVAESFPDPARFNPERYAQESQNNPFAWIGFGGGKHKCTGSAFGVLQLKSIVASLLREYEFELVREPGDYRDDYKKPTVLPESPCLLRYRRRDRSKLVRPTAHTGENAPLPIVTSELRVIVDRHLCQGHAVCVSEAPEVFAVGDDSVAEVVLDTKNSAVRRTGKDIRFYPPTELNQQVILAAKYCPNHAIRIEEAAEEEA